MIENLRDYMTDSGEIDLESLFLDVKNLIYSTCLQFYRQYGYSEVDELNAIASLRFLSIVGSYKEERASFSYWLRKKIWSHLLDVMKIQLRRLSKLPRTEFTFSTIPAKTFCFQTYKKELTLDAQIVLNLLTSGHCDNVTATVNRVQNYRSFVSVDRVKKAIENELVQSWDWSRERVRSAFVEISKSLPT